MKKILILTLAVISAVSVFAVNQQKLSARTSAMMLSRQAESRDSVVSAYIYVDQAALDRDALSSLDVKIVVEVSGMVTARVPLDNLQALTQVTGVNYVQAATPVRPMVDIARVETGAAAVNAGSQQYQPYTGKGVIVGIVDSGFDYAHAAFKDETGALRISRVWEQGSAVDKIGHLPESFGYGVEMTDPEEILTAAADRRNNSHGSHVTSLAAGSDTYLDGVLKGMAPDAEIVLVSMTEAGVGNVNISDAIAYIFKYADSVDRPCVINLSLGAHYGPHDGTSPFDTMADALQGPGRLIVGAAGNSADPRFHIHRQFVGADDEPLRTFVDYVFSMSEKNKGGDIDIWADASTAAQVYLCVYKLSSAEVVERVSVYPTPSLMETNLSLGRNVGGFYVASSEINPANGKIHVALTSAITSIRTGYAIAIEVNPEGAGNLDIWADNQYVNFTSRGIDGFTEADGATISEIGGTAQSILTVGAYTTRRQYLPLGETVMRETNETEGDLCSFSCYGPTADGRMKPQITAPGSMIMGAVSRYDGSGTVIYAQYHTDNYYGFMQGTSMATPIVTGIVATWLEAYPDMTPGELADIVAQTARTDDYTVNADKWGYGKIDAYQGMCEAVRRNASVGSVVADGADLMVYFDGSILFRNDISNAEISVYSMLGACVANYTLSHVSAGDSLPLSLAPGIYVISCTAQGKTQTLKVKAY